MAISKIESASLASGVPTRSQLPAGTVLQVVSANYTTQVTTSSSSYSSTGLTATITPTSATSKILVFTSPSCVISGSQGVNSSGFWAIFRNGSQVSGDYLLRTYAYGASGGVYTNVPAAMNYADSPASTSALAYTLYFKVGVSTGIYINGDSSSSSITLMEIAA